MKAAILARARRRTRYALLFGLVLAVTSAIGVFAASSAEAKPDYKCWDLTENHMIFVPGEGWWKCVCVDFDDPDTGEDTMCEWIQVNEDGRHRYGRVQIPFQRFGFNVGGTANVDPDGDTDATVWAFDDNNWNDVFNQPPGELALESNLMKWNSSTAQWDECRTTNWLFNSVTTFAIGTGPDWGTAPCGSGYYETWANTFTWDTGAWRGGTVYSGWHWQSLPPLLTATSSETAADVEAARAAPPTDLSRATSAATVSELPPRPEELVKRSPDGNGEFPVTHGAPNNRRPTPWQRP